MAGPRGNLLGANFLTFLWSLSGGKGVQKRALGKSFFKCGRNFPRVISLYFSGGLRVLRGNGIIFGFTLLESWPKRKIFKATKNKERPNYPQFPLLSLQPFAEGATTSAGAHSSTTMVAVQQKREQRIKRPPPWVTALSSHYQA